MTLTTTHIGLESIFVWVMMGKKNRKIFREKLWLFTLLTLFAFFPDLDYIFYIHRTYLHSIIWPIAIILGVLGWLSFKKLIKKETVGVRADLICRSIIIASVFLILHSFLDLNPGPVLLFYPFDNRLYEWNVSMVWDLDSIFIFKELKFNWTSLSFNEGIEHSLFNLTPQQRIDYFGAEFVELFIRDFPIHLLVVLGWFIVFPVMSLIQLVRRYDKPQNFFKTLKKFKNPLLASGIILLTLGLTLGPGFGLNRIEDRVYTRDLSFSEETANFGFYQKYELDKNDALNFNAIFAGNNSACEIAAVLATEEQFTNVDESLSDLFEQYNNKTIYDYNWLVSNYKVIVETFIMINSLDYYFITQNTTEGITYTLDEKMTIYAVITLFDWDSSVDFNIETQTVSTLHIKRTLEFSFGLSFAVIGAVAFVFPIVDTTLKLKKKKEETESESIEEK